MMATIATDGGHAVTHVSEAIAALCRDFPQGHRGTILAMLLDAAVAELDLPEDMDGLRPDDVPATSTIARALSRVSEETLDCLCVLAPVAWNGGLPGQNGEADEAAAMAGAAE